MSEPYRIVALAPEHDRAGFVSGVDVLDRYFREQVTQDARRRVTTRYVAIDAVSGLVVGYYTPAAAGILLADLPDRFVKRLPRYPSIPTARIGRLAVSLDHRGRGLGSGMLFDAIMRATRSEIAVFALVVDAKDDRAAAFYRHHGFVDIAGQANQLILPLAKIKVPRPTLHVCHQRIGGEADRAISVSALPAKGGRSTHRDSERPARRSARAAARSEVRTVAPRRSRWIASMWTVAS